MVASGDPDAGVHVDGHLGHDEVAGQGQAHPVGDDAGVAGGTAGQHDGELVATEPGQDVAVADGGPEPDGDLLQEVVAAGVAEGVVDLLEPVEVDHEDGEVVVAVRQFGLQGRAEGGAVRQARQQVVQRAVLHLLQQHPLPHAGGLGEAPHREGPGAGGREQQGVHDRELPRVVVGGRVVEDDLRVQRPDDPVLEQDVPDGHGERRPRLVERDDGDHDEEVEVRLGPAGGDLHDLPRGHDEAEGRGARAQPRGRPGRQRGVVGEVAAQVVEAGGGEEDGQDGPEPGGLQQRQLPGHGVGGDDEDVHEEHRADPAVAPSPLGRGQGVALRQPAGPGVPRGVADRDSRRGVVHPLGIGTADETLETPAEDHPNVAMCQRTTTQRI